MGTIHYTVRKNATTYLTVCMLHNKNVYVHPSEKKRSSIIFLKKNNMSLHTLLCNKHLLLVNTVFIKSIDVHCT